MMILLFSVIKINAQNIEITDSLFERLNETNSPEEKIRLFFAIKDVYSGNDFDKALQYARLALMEAQNSDYKEYIADAYFSIGDIMEGEEQYNEAIEYYIKSYNEYLDLENKQGIADVSFNLADVYKKKGYYQMSMEKCLEGLGIYESLNDSTGMSYVFNCMGSLYKYQDNPARAIEYYNRSLEIRKALNDLDGIALCYNNIGVVYSREESYDLALDFYTRALEINLRENDLKDLAINYNNIANIYLSENDYEKALEYINLSLETNNKVGYTRGVANQTESLGRYYYLRNDFETSIKYYLEAFELYRDLGRLENEANITEDISEAYNQIGDFENAFIYLKLHQNFSDSIFNIEKMKNIAGLEIEFNQLKDKELHELQEQRRRAINTTIGLSLLFSLVIAILLFSRQRIKNRQQSLNLKNIELEKIQIESDLEQKQKELAAYTIYRVRKNEILSDIISRLNNSLVDLKDKNIPIIKEIIEDLKNSTDFQIWDEFELRFLKVHEGFYDNLAKEFPELTTNEKRLSAFLRLDFSTKEISSITNQSPHSINIARTRLRRKLGLSNTDTNLSAFLTQF